MAYVCISHSENGFCVAKRLVRFFVNGKPYEIIGENNDEYYIITPDKKIKVRGFTINVDLVVVISENEPIEGWFCKDLDELK
jgi:hypothetical protein